MCTRAGSAGISANRITIESVAVHVDLFGIEREPRSYYETFCRSIGNPYPGRKQFFRDLNVAIRGIQRHTAEDDLICRKVIALDAAICSMRNRIVFPSSSVRDRQLAVHLPLVAKIHAVLPRP